MPKPSFFYKPPLEKKAWFWLNNWHCEFPNLGEKVAWLARKLVCDYILAIH
jgi:hypothetical protein